MILGNTLNDDLKNEVKEYLNYLYKYKAIIIGLYLVLEAIIFIRIGRTNTFMTLSSLFITLFIICSIILMFKDFKTTLRIYTISIPLLPLILYLLFRLNLTAFSEVIYVLYFAIFMYNAFQEIRRGNIDFKRLYRYKNYLLITIVYITFIVLGIISAFNSRYMMEGFKFLFLGLVIMLIYSVILLCYTGEDKDSIVDLVFYLCVGVALSGIPDTLIAFYTLITRGQNQHLYGALGSNFMLGYTIIVLPFILYFAVNKDEVSKYSSIYKLLLVIEILVLCTQRSRGILVVLAFVLLAVLITDIKNVLKYLLISIIILSSVTYNVTERSEFNEIKQEIKQNPNVAKRLFSKGEFLNKIIEQTRNRRPIWGLTFNIIADHPNFGIGPGHYKYYYLEYGGEESRSYKDAHNIVLNVAVDMGLPFAFLFYFTICILILKSLIYALKSKIVFEKRFLFLGIVGILALLMYGNITGQAFMTFVAPISITPAFTFTVIITSIIAMKAKFK